MRCALPSQLEAYYLSQLLHMRLVERKSKTSMLRLVRSILTMPGSPCSPGHSRTLPYPLTLIVTSMTVFISFIVSQSQPAQQVILRGRVHLDSTGRRQRGAGQSTCGRSSVPTAQALSLPTHRFRPRNGQPRPPGGYAPRGRAFPAADAGEATPSVCGIAARCHLSSRSAPLAQAGWAPAVAVGTAAAAGRRLFSSDLSGLPHDKILLRGLVFHGYHGVLPEVGAGAVV